ADRGADVQGSGGRSANQQRPHMAATGGAPAGDQGVHDMELGVGALQHLPVAVRVVHALGRVPVAMLQTRQDHGADAEPADVGPADAEPAEVEPAGIQLTGAGSAEAEPAGTEPAGIAPAGSGPDVEPPAVPGALAAASSDRAVGAPIVVIRPVSTVSPGPKAIPHTRSRAPGRARSRMSRSTNITVTLDMFP